MSDVTPIEQNISQWVDELLAMKSLNLNARVLRDLSIMCQGTMLNSTFFAQSPLCLAQLIIALIEERADHEHDACNDGIGLSTICAHMSREHLEMILEKFGLSPAKFDELRAKVEEIENE